MVVKDRVGRPRYVVFAIEPGRHERGAFIGALNRISSRKCLKPSPRLTVFDGTMGIVKCDHREMDRVRALLPEISDIAGKKVTVITVRTSGTLRKAKEYLR